jgi:DNA polymerase III epsilon subunit-like protein
MTPPYYIALDIELGGLEREHSLLTAYFSVLDEQFEEIAELYLFVKPNDDKGYVIDPEAMAVNRINLIEHDQIAIPSSEAGQLLFKFLRDWSGNGQYKLVPIGHGVIGDLQCIWEKLLRRKVFEQFCSYRKIDTSAVTQFLKAVGMFPQEVSGSLGSLIEHFKLKGVTNSHDAKDDTRATVAILQELIKLVIKSNGSLI